MNGFAFCEYVSGNDRTTFEAFTRNRRVQLAEYRRGSDVITT